MFVRNDAKEFRFCRSKCHKNFKMKRSSFPLSPPLSHLLPANLSLSLSLSGNPRKLKWTKAFRKSAGKEMIVDTTLTFASRRHVPTRYSRDLVAKTLTAMQRVEEIRSRRERVFYRNRMAGNKQRERDANRKIVEENQHLLPREQRTVVDEQVEHVEIEEGMEISDVEEEPEMVKVKVKVGKRRTKVGAGDGMDVD